MDEPAVDVTNLHHRRAVQRWERTSIGDLLERVTWSHPDEEAIVGLDGACADPRFQRLTYRQADELADQVAHGLRAHGLGQGDVLMMFCENSVEGLLVKLGAAKTGVVVAPLNPMMAPDVVAAMIELVSPRAAVVDAGLWPRAEEPFTSAGVPIAATITIDGGPVARSVSFTDFVADQPATEPDVEIHGDDIWEILFTSGTTALPKGVMLSHTSSYMAAYSFTASLTRALRFESGLRLGTLLPILYHSGDQLFVYSVFLSAGTLVLGRHPEAAETARMVAEERLTALWGGSPAMVSGLDEALRARPELDARSLTVIVYGWAALPPPVLDSLKERCGSDLIVFEIFGQTESISCHRFWPDKWPEVHARSGGRQNYVGVPNPLLAATVFDPLGNDLAGEPGVPGEAVYRSPAIMAGYYQDEEATRTVFRDGWFHSGDSCSYDEDGLRIMVDRYKDNVKTGGENVSSLRVEAVLRQHPAVHNVAVVGLPHPYWGEAVTALVVRQDSDTEAAELVQFCRSNLAGYETPKDVVFVDELPATVGGKVLKYKLRTQYANHYEEVAST